MSQTWAEADARGRGPFMALPPSGFGVQWPRGCRRGPWRRAGGAWACVLGAWCVGWVAWPVPRGWVAVVRASRTVGRHAGPVAGGAGHWVQWPRPVPRGPLRRRPAGRPADRGRRGGDRGPRFRASLVGARGPSLRAAVYWARTIRELFANTARTRAAVNLGRHSRPR